MPRASYQYGTSPRKYEPEYTPRTTSRKAVNKTNIKKADAKKAPKKSEATKRIEKRKAKKQERKSRTLQIVVVMAIFGMLLALSYREITIMEMFDQKKKLETQLSVIQKENGQIEKSIKEEESKLNWNEIQKIASEQLGMQRKVVIPVDLQKTDNIETTTKFIKEEEIKIVKDIIEYFINK